MRDEASPGTSSRERSGSRLHRIPAVAGRSARQSRILSIHTTGASTPLTDMLEQSLVSLDAPWKDILLVEEHDLPAAGWRQMCPRDHLLMLCTGKRCTISWRSGGHPQQSASLPEQGVWVVNAGTPLWWVQSQQSKLLFVALPPAFVATAARPGGTQVRPPHNGVSAFEDQAIEHLMLAVRAEVLDGCPAGRLYGVSLSVALIQRLLQRGAIPIGCGPALGSPVPDRVCRVLDYIEANLGEQLTVGKLAELANMAPHQFVAMFKQSTACPPHRYILRKRIAVSQHLLAATTLSLAEIGCALGFPSQAHFTTMFRKITGATPNRYRKIRQES